MTGLLEMGLFLLGIFLGLWWSSVFLLPLFYGFPRGIFYVIKGWAKFRAPLLYLVTPVIWTVALFIIVLLLVIFAPNIVAYLNSSRGFALGQIVGIGLLIVRAIFSRSTHIDMSLDFYDFIRPHLTSAGAVHVGAIPAIKANTANKRSYEDKAHPRTGG